jgi:hypothetical protein
MIVTDPTMEGNRAGPPRRSGKLSRMVVLGLVLLFVLVVILRNDIWNWNTPYPLLFGFLPVGLWWQGMVSILAAVMMWLMVRLAWPHELEDLAERHGSTDTHNDVSS